MNRFTPVVLIPCLIGAACSQAHDRNAANAAGSAQLTITTVPASVGCVALIAAASRNVTASVDVTTGETVTLTMNDIPAGEVTFTAFGFAQSCNATAGAQPTWGSRPTIATIVPGQVTSLQLALDQVGGANVGISFNTDAGAPNDLSTPPDLTAPTVVLAVNPAMVDFGTVTLFSAPPPQIVNIVNNGTGPSGPLQLQLGGTNPASFTATGCSGVIVPPGKSCALTVGLQLAVFGDVNATLNVSASPGNSVVVPLHGNLVL
jgi:hypothetical protein